MILVTDGSQARDNNLILSGIVMRLINPYWRISWATIGLGCMLHTMNAGTRDVVAVSTALWKGRQRLSDRSCRTLIGTSAVCLIIFFCLFAWSGI
ncbi:MAG: hypothetical protein V2I40_06215 [Desulfobacteraceae bacterium]|jgi:hypothetical protein|nr:hypothetical protein [Desulfobacteraceae bacterium]